MLKRIRQQWKTYMGGSRMAAAGCIVLAVWILLAVTVPLVSPWSYSAQDAQIRNQGVSLLHWFGTDRFGRDLFTRVWYGAGISLTVGIASALINGAIGVLYGYGSRAEFEEAGADGIAADIPALGQMLLGR